MKVPFIISLLLAYCVLSETTFIGNEEPAINAVLNQSKVVVCYVTLWSTSRSGRGEFNLENIDTTLCTHFTFGYLHLNETHDEIVTTESWTKLLGDKPGDRIAMLKVKNPNVKALVSVGGWLDGSIKYSQLAANPKHRQRFINNTIRFIQENGLDGLDLIWQYPGKRGGSPVDKENYIQLLKELREALHKQNLMLTACVGSSKDTIDYGYDVPKLSEYLDYMLFYTYDYHGWWSRHTGANAGLTGPDFLNVEFATNHLLKLGAEPKKLILGIPLFARNYILNDTTTFNSNMPQFGQKFVGQGFQGPYTIEDGYMGYNEVCLCLQNKSQNWTVFWDEESNTPMAVFEDKMISYDDVKSIILKAKFALNNKLGGFFAYTIDVDDFHGDCGQRYPLLRAINDELSRYKYEVDNIISTDEIKSATNVRCGLSYVLSVILLMTLRCFM